MPDDPRDFWDIADLVPPRKASAGRTPPRYSTEANEILIPVPSEKQAAGGVPTTQEKEPLLADRPVDPFAVPPEKPTPILCYRPERSLLREVRIYPWRVRYTYYEQFYRMAHRNFAREGAPCEETEFFAYMPQYTQLTAPQEAYYFWWRTNFRKGKCLPASFSYLLLFLYELINTQDLMQPAQGQAQMLQLWFSYRGEHPRLDTLIREWLCDHALIHQLPPPVLPHEMMGEVLSGRRLKEFYVSGMRDTDDEVTAMLAFCNNYDYTKSKFYTDETAGLYDRVLAGGVKKALIYYRKNNKNAAPEAISTLKWDAFLGAICACSAKYTIEVEFSSFSHSSEMRYVITDVLKYCENGIRAALSIKSRLTVYQVPTPLCHELDAYLEQVLPKKAPKRGEKKQIPEYERRYELPRHTLDLRHAARIEADSWETTQKLVETFAQEPQEAPRAVLQAPAVFAENPTDVMRFSEDLPENDKAADAPSLKRALGALCEFVRLAAAKDKTAQRAFAQRSNEMLDAVADRVNTVAGDVFGDILLEDLGGYYGVIEDYLALLEEEQIL